MKALPELKAENFGIEESKANEIKAQFEPMLNLMASLEDEYNEVIKMPIEEAQEAARELRKKYVKVRTGTAKIHKDQKAFYRSAGLYIDGFKNAQLFAGQGIETRLKEIEDHAEIQEQKRVKALNDARSEELMQYGIEVVPEGLGLMNEAVWSSFLTGTKINYEARIKAEQDAEAERLEKELAKKIHSERKEQLIPYWNFVPERTPSDLSELPKDHFDKLMVFVETASLRDRERQKEIEVENARLLKEKEAADKKAQEAQIEAEKQANKEREEHEKQMQAEREKNAALEAAVKAAQVKEAKQIALAKEKEQNALKASDADKVKNFNEEVLVIRKKYRFKSEVNKNKFAEAARHLDAALLVMGYKTGNQNNG